MPKAVSAINLEQGCVRSMTGFTHLNDFISSQPTTNPEERTAGQVMNYTSGTTGKPKGVKRALVPGTLMMC